MKYVIIGNSAAAIGTVEGIRQVDKEGSITIISSEPYHTYCRPLISYLLAGKTDREKMKYRPDNFYKDNNCQVKLGVTVTAINPKEKTLALDNGETEAYDKLMVATGSSPANIPIEGIETVPSVHYFMTLDDANGIEWAINEHSRVLILGGGFVGLKCAEGLLGRVAEVTVVNKNERILPNNLEAHGAFIIKQHLESLGMKFMLSNTITSFEGNKAHMFSGDTVEFDVFIMAVGVRPRTSLIADIGGEVDRGIIVDKHGRTSIPDIYAAGDCVESDDVSAGVRRILAIMPNAYLQGECAGKNMAGEETVFDKAIPMNATSFCGLHVVTAGTYEGEVYEVRDEQNFKRLYYKDDKLVGYILVGDEVARAGIYTSMIRNSTPLSSLDFELMKDHPQLAAYTSEHRTAILNKGRQEGGIQ